jgi:hypothetical protein
VHGDHQYVSLTRDPSHLSVQSAFASTVLFRTLLFAMQEMHLMVEVARAFAHRIQVSTSSFLTC